MSKRNTKGGKVRNDRKAWGVAETVSYPGEDTLGEADDSEIADLMAQIEHTKIMRTLYEKG